MPRTSQSLINCMRMAVGAWRDDPRDDATLLALFAEDGDEAAFRALIWRHGLLVWRTCRRILGDTPDAEDAFQTTFLALARKAGRFPVESLAGWLYRVARQDAMHVRAGARRRRGLEQQLKAGEDAGGVRKDASQAELHAALDEEMADLPERLRVPLLLHYLEGKSQVEVARLLGCSRGVVRYRLARGEAALRKRLERRGLAMGIGSIAMMLGSTAGASGVPARLIGSTARAAAAFRSGALTGGAAEAARAVLGALPHVETTILWKSLWIVLACCLGLGGATLVTYRSLSAQPDEPGEAGLAAMQAPGERGAGGRAAARVDCYGDPLPTGALARMGTVRQWYGRLDFIPNPTVLAFSPDGKTLVSQKDTGFSSACSEYVCLWDAATGKELRRITTDPRTHAITLLALSPDGRTLVTAKKGTVYLWEMATGKLLHKWEDQGPQRGAHFRFMGITFLPNGKILTLDEAGDDVNRSDNRIYLWDVATGGREISQLSGRWKKEGRGFGGTFSTFSSNSKLIATTERGSKFDGNELTHQTIISLWDVATGKKIRELTCEDEGVNAMAFSPDGKTLASGNSGSDSEAICVWEVATGKPIHRFKGGRSRPSCPLAYSPDGKTLLGGWEGHLWDMATGKEIRSFGWENARVAVFSSSGKVLAVGDQAGVIRLLDTATGKEILPHKGHQDRVAFIAYSPDGKTLASTSWDKTVRLWEVATGKEIRQLAKHATLRIGPLAYSPDGTMLASMDDAIHLWDTATGKEIRYFKEGGNPKSAAFSPDGKFLAAALTNKTVWVWQVATGRQIHKLAISGWPVAFSPDGRMLAAPGKDGTVDLWEAATGRPIGQLQLKRDGRVMSLAFSPDSRMLATSSKRGMAEGDKAHLWEVASGKEICQLNGRKASWEGGRLLTFSPNGRMLATVDERGNDKKIHLWEVTSGKEIGQLSGHRSTIQCVAFSPDGKTLASGSDDLTCLVWDLTSVDPLKPVRTPPHVPQALAKERLEAAWADLAKDPAQAYAAIRVLQVVPAQAIPLLRERVRPMPVEAGKRLARLVADLDADDFKVRQKAYQELEKYGPDAGPTLRKGLEGRPPLGVRKKLEQLLVVGAQHMTGFSGEVLRGLRAVEVLERAGTPEAQQVLKILAAGAPGFRLTQEAQAALDRLVKLSADKP